MKKRFRLLARDGKFELFKNDTVEEFQLDSEQHEFLLRLDGTIDLSEIIKEYDLESRDAITDLLDELRALGALEELSESSQRIFPQKYPFPYLEAVLWDVTSLCNLKCAHCYVSGYSNGARGSDLTTEEALRVIDEMAEMNVRDVSLTGGEPFQRKDFRDIVSRIVDGNIRIASIFTNGVDVDRDMINFFVEQVKLPRRCRIRISLDGMTPESNSVLRGKSREVEAVFKKTLETIRNFVEAGFLVSIGTSIHKSNVRQLPEMYSFVKDLGIQEWRMAVPKPIGQYKDTEVLIGASWDEVLASYKRVIDAHLADCRMIGSGVEYPIKVDIEQTFRTELIEKVLNTFNPDDIVCFYHKSRCSVKANGDVTPCGYFDHVVTGNVRMADGLRQAWESVTMQQIKQMRIRDISECRGCSLLHTCGTGCRAIASKINGNPCSKDPYACRTAPLLEEYIAVRLKEHGLHMIMSDGCMEYSVAENSPL
ncbi:radical SAM protein [Patescibacteria group bacterium]|nr:radical SAM protein [Patescibacteria group bacterium]